MIDDDILELFKDPQKNSTAYLFSYTLKRVHLEYSQTLKMSVNKNFGTHV